MRKLGSIGALILLFLFLCSATMLLILEVTAYEQVVQSSQEQIDIRVPIQYLAEKLRMFDCKDGVEVKEIQGTDVLVFTEKNGQDTYETWLYGYNGNLYEISKRKAGKFKLEDGKIVTKANILSITAIQPNLIKIRLKDQEGIEDTYVFALRSNLKAVQYET